MSPELDAKPDVLRIGPAFLIAISLLSGCAAEAPPARRTVLPGRTTVLLGPTEVCMPLHAWLLLRHENRICALRIDAVWLEDEVTHARLEAAVSADGRWIRKPAEVAEYPLGGPHPFSFQRGNVAIPCGTFEADYSRPSCIRLYTSRRGGDDDRVEAAPSAWTSLERVNPSDPRLTWYTVDHDRAAEVEMSRLPGGTATH